MDFVLSIVTSMVRKVDLRNRTQELFGFVGTFEGTFGESVFPTLCSVVPVSAPKSEKGHPVGWPFLHSAGFFCFVAVADMPGYRHGDPPRSDHRHHATSCDAALTFRGDAPRTRLNAAPKALSDS